MRIAFLGLGHMGIGLPMAQNLIGAGHALTVFNPTGSGTSPLVAQGAKAAGSVAEAVESSEVVITMLLDDDALREVVHGPSGLLENLAPKAIHLCMGTAGVETSAALAAAHAKASQGYVAAPVFGKASAAGSSHLWILAAGPEPQVKRCRPIFEAVGAGHMYLGPHAAQAHALKLGGNMLNLAMEMAVSEILEYAKKAGLAPANYLRFLNTAIFKAHMVDDYGRAPARPSFDPEDNTLDLAAAELLPQTFADLGLEIPLTDLLEARRQAATARGWGAQDLAELTQAFEAATGAGREPLQEPFSLPPGPVAPRGTRKSPPGKPSALPSAPSPQEEPPPRVIPMPHGEADATRTPPGPREIPPVSPTTLPPHLGRYTALVDGTTVALDLGQTSHFELIKGCVWAWSRGHRYQTSWKSLPEVELAFNHILFVPLKRTILLRPEAVLEVLPTFGGGAKARIAGPQELVIGRTALTRLKELLGI